MNIWVAPEGVWVTVTSPTEGATFLLPAHWTIGAIQNSLKELAEFYTPLSTPYCNECH